MNARGWIGDLQLMATFLLAPQAINKPRGLNRRQSPQPQAFMGSKGPLALCRRRHFLRAIALLRPDCPTDTEWLG
jgi:hypothetical protein